MDWADILISSILELARIIIIFIYFKTFCEESSKRWFVTGTAAYLLTTGTYLVFDNNYINVVATIAGIIIISLGFASKMRRRVLLSIMCYAIMIAIDFLTVFIAPVDMNNNIVVFSFTSVLLFYIFVMLLRLLFKNKIKSEFSGQWYILLVVSIMSVCILFIINKEVSISRSGVIVLSVIVLVLNMLLYVFYSSMLDRFVYEQDILNLKQQMTLYEQQIRVNVENDTEIRAIRHDMKHHIREINDLADKGKMDELKKYTRTLNADIKEYETVYDTGNAALDGLLNYYFGVFSEKGIQTDINVSIPKNMGLSTYDLNIILGNLLDNALENTVKAMGPEIAMNVNYAGGVLHISIKNTYDGLVKKKDEKILSRKSGEHGYGLNNIERICKKYGGDKIVDYNEEWFRVRMVMYI